MDKIKEDVAAMSANISAHTPEHMLKVVDPSGQLPVSTEPEAKVALTESQLKEFLKKIFEEDESETLTVD